MSIFLKKFKIKNFRSISEPLELNFINNKLTILCGPNNVGKTNCLRALNLFFNMDKDLFEQDNDIPFHILYGARGGGNETSLTGTFIDSETNVEYEIKQVYKERNKQNYLEITAKSKQDKNFNTVEAAKKLIKKFEFVFVEASNVNLPVIIKRIFKDQLVPMGIQGSRRQGTALEILGKFHDICLKATENIEKNLTSEFKNFIDVSLFDQDISDYKFKVTFPQFDSLQEAVTNSIDCILYDKNDLPIESKGSGFQRLALISLISYYTKLRKKNLIWGIDEPEAFLQPILQKYIFQKLKNFCKDLNIIITTHSNFFIDIDDLETTYFLNEEPEKKSYVRANGKDYWKSKTYVDKKIGYQKLELIKKHMGIEKNDSWELYPTNILVEGECDKRYIEALAYVFNLKPPKIIVAGGADCMPIHLSYYNNQAEDIKEFKPQILCLLDFDQKGREVYEKIKTDKYKNIEVTKKYICNSEGITESGYEIEIEDFIYPELICDQINKFLRTKKKYKEVTNALISQRSNLVYRQKSLLEFLTIKATERNSNKPECKLYDQHIKMEICKEVVKEIKSNMAKIENLNENNPNVKEFIKSLFNSFT